MSAYVVLLDNRLLEARFVVFSAAAEGRIPETFAVFAHENRLLVAREGGILMSR